MLLFELCCKSAVYVVVCVSLFKVVEEKDWCVLSWVRKLMMITLACQCLVFSHLPEEEWRWAWLWGSRAWPAAPVSSPLRAGSGVCQVSIIYRWERQPHQTHINESTWWEPLYINLFMNVIMTMHAWLVNTSVTTSLCGFQRMHSVDKHFLVVYFQ